MHFELSLLQIYMKVYTKITSKMIGILIAVDEVMLGKTIEGGGGWYLN